jgi:hypothetical protein
MADDNEPPKIQIDSDWKAQAQAEKEKLVAQERAGKAGSDPADGGEGGGGGDASSLGSGADPGSGQMPPANFETLVSTFITQALFSMGAIPDPQTGQPVVHLDVARHHIDMLSVVEEKTKGNLSDDESKLLAGALYELRSRYVQVANAGRGS